MSPDDFINSVVVAVTHTHGHFHVLAIKLFGIKSGLDGQDIIKRCHREPAARLQFNAEILRMAIGRPHQPVQNVGLEEICLIPFRFITAAHEFYDVYDPGTSGRGLIFLRRGNPKRLTAIFLRQSDKPSICSPEPVETLYRQSLLICEHVYRCIGSSQSETFDEF